MKKITLLLAGGALLGALQPVRAGIIGYPLPEPPLDLAPMDGAVDARGEALQTPSPTPPARPGASLDGETATPPSADSPRHGKMAATDPMVGMGGSDTSAGPRQSPDRRPAPPRFRPWGQQGGLFPAPPQAAWGPGYGRRPRPPAYSTPPASYRPEPGYGFQGYQDTAGRYPDPAAAAGGGYDYPNPATRPDSGWPDAGYGQYPDTAGDYRDPAATGWGGYGFPGPGARTDADWQAPGYGHERYPDMANRYYDPAAAGWRDYGYPGTATRQVHGWQEPAPYFGEETAPPVPAYALPLSTPRDITSGYQDYSPRYDRPFFPGRQPLPGNAGR